LFISPLGKALDQLEGSDTVGVTTSEASRNSWPNQETDVLIAVVFKE
jgi:hypothetical protein